MKKAVLKGLLIGLIGVSFSACMDGDGHSNKGTSTKESSHKSSKTDLSNSHTYGIHSNDSVSAQHQKNLKKKRKERFEARKRQRAKELAKETKKKETKELTKKDGKKSTKKAKFCFKDSSSIHYRASQRCK